MNRTALRRLLAFCLIVAAGVFVYLLLQWTATTPERRPARDRGRPVRVMTVASMEVVPTAVGYGVVSAQRSWQGIAEVGGTILEMDPRVEVGRIVREGALLFRIDPESVEVETARTEATVRAVRAQLNELSARQSSARASLELERRVLEMAQKDLERARQAHQSGLAPLTDVENAERGVLSAQKAVQSLQNTLLELPAARRVLEAQLAQHQAGAKGARLGLAKTEVIAPFTMRISQVNASLHQTVNPGQVVVVGDSIDVLEVVAQFPVGTTGALMGSRNESGASSSSGERAHPKSDSSTSPEPTSETATAETATTEAAPPPASQASGRRRSWRQRISATVYLKSQGLQSSWDASFRRFQGVDPLTRTMGVVVTVDAPRRRSGRTGPPLLPGLHVEVELRGAPRPSCLAVPRSALRDGELYVVDAKKRLERRPVELDLEQEKYVCVASGVSAGEQVVLTDVVPAVQGMLLEPRNDEVAGQLLQEAASLAQAGPTETQPPVGANPPAAGEERPPAPAGASASPAPAQLHSEDSVP